MQNNKSNEDLDKDLKAISSQVQQKRIKTNN